MSGLQITPDELEKAGKNIEGTSETFNTVLEEFRSTIEGIGDACGGDEIGGLIGDAHQAIYEAAMECFQEAAQSMKDAGFDVQDFAIQHLAADEEIAQAFKTFQSDMGGKG
ncbi:WXG100 family type VII secretion target [Glycomyces harbinensis]|uniref:Uncharacterized conserved protein YukE n=1 Tax=Glycomyces harbinensis TaxID=58114 RepID=A0A1G6T0R1_9ACTN|nr:hypothetical protein [Glycomyces harbinensis]SDD22057.1 Uncharacterized conserved protein YukE [Glycomyces harbinensis]